MVAVRRERERAGVATDDDLAALLGIEDAFAGVRRTRVAAQIRRDLLFRGDAETAQAAKKASDGFEHGFLDFGEVRGLARESRDRTATYMRSAILELAVVESRIRDVLLADPYHKPLRSHVTRYLWGKLRGEGDDLAGPDQEYPIFKWRSKLKKFRRNEDGTYTMTPDETVTASFAERLSMHDISFEAWAADGIKIVAPSPDDQPTESSR